MLAVPAYCDARERTVKGNVGNGDGSARADEGGDFGSAVSVNRQDGAGDNDVVAKVIREQGTHGAVDHTGGENRLKAGSRLAALKAAGDATNGVKLFFKIDCEREKVDSVAGAR